MSEENTNREESEKDNVDETKKFISHEIFSPMQDINNVFEACKFGRFHIRLLLTTFAGSIASILVTNSTSYLLSIAECDLDMDLRQKGLLVAIPYLGMLISAVISGFLIDVFGRIVFMKIAFGGLFIFAVSSAASQNFMMIAITKFGEGFFSAIAVSGLSSITAEFCHHSIRDRMLLVQSSYSALAQVIAALISWGILTQNWNLILIEDFFVLKIWNFYLVVISLWSLAAFILFTTIPESPKFLVTQHKYLEAKNILIQVYKENIGKNAETFPEPNLWIQSIQEENNLKLASKINLKSLGHQISDGAQNMKPLLLKPLIFYLAIIGFMQLVIMGSYNVLRLWFPQLSTIVEHYKLDVDHNLCVLLDTYTADQKSRSGNLTHNITNACVPNRSGTATYVHSIIIGLVCIIPYLISGVIVNKVGKKRLLIASGLICIGGLLGIRWASSKIMMVSLIAVVVAIMQTMKGLVGIVLVEVFPTTMRSLAMAIVMCIARIGNLVAHIGFPILLDMGCELPFYVMTGTMICCVGMCFFIPKKKRI